MPDKLANLRVNINTADQSVAYRFMVHQPSQIAPMLPGVLQQHKKSIIVFNGKAELYWQRILRNVTRNVFSLIDDSVDSRVTQKFLNANEGILLTTLSSLEAAPKLVADAIFVLHLNFKNSESKELQSRLRNIYLQSSAAEVTVYFFFPDAPLDLSCESFINGFMDHLPSQSQENANTAMEAEPQPIFRSQNKRRPSGVLRRQKKRRTERPLSPKPVFDRISGLWKSSQAISEQPPMVSDESSLLPPATQKNVDRDQKPKTKLRPAKPRPTFQSPVPIEVPLGDTASPIVNRSHESGRVITVMQLKPS